MSYISKLHRKISCHAQSSRWIGFVCLLATCQGCWEEVRYDPSQASVSDATSTTQQQSSAKQDVPVEQEHQFASPTDDNSNSNAPELGEQNDTEIKSVETSIAEDTIIEAPSLEQEIPTTIDVKETETPFEPAPQEATSEETTVEEKAEEQPNEFLPTTTSHDASAVWQMSSKWSLAAGYFAKGLSADRYGEILDQARYAASLLEIDLPDFAGLTDEANRQAAVAKFLIEEADPLLVEQIAASDPQQAALADFAIKTHALLLVYTPLNKDLDAIISEIRSSAQKSQLPKEIWQPIVDLLEQQAPFQEVKQEVFKLHELAAAHFNRVGSP